MTEQDYEKLAEDGRSIDEAELLDLSIKGDFGHDAACDFRIGFRYGHKRGHADGIKWARENPPPEVLELVEALEFYKERAFGAGISTSECMNDDGFKAHQTLTRFKERGRG